MAKNVKRRAEKSFDSANYLKLPYSRVVVPENDGTFRAEILEFPGCIATGDTEAEALAALTDVALSWLESVAAMGKEIPKPIENLPYSGKLVLRMPKTLHKKAARAAERDGVSLNQFIVSSLAEQIGMRSGGNVQKQPFSHVVQAPIIVGDPRPVSGGTRQTISTPVFQGPIETIVYPNRQLTGAE